MQAIITIKPHMPSKKVPRLAYGEKGGVFFFKMAAITDFGKPKCCHF